jgi:hypothetical protein
MTNKGSRSCTEPQGLTERSLGSDSRRRSSGVVIAGTQNDSELKGSQRRQFLDWGLANVRCEAMFIRINSKFNSPVQFEKIRQTIEAIWKASLQAFGYTAILAGHICRSLLRFDVFISECTSDLYV